MLDVPEWSEAAKSVALGIYQHYKGDRYEVLGVAHHTETLEELVVYRDVKDPLKVWTRPVEMFLESVEIGDQKVPRFTKLS